MSWGIRPKIQTFDPAELCENLQECLMIHWSVRGAPDDPACSSRIDEIQDLLRKSLLKSNSKFQKKV